MMPLVDINLNRRHYFLPISTKNNVYDTEKCKLKYTFSLKITKYKATVSWKLDHCLPHASQMISFALTQSICWKTKVAIHFPIKKKMRQILVIKYSKQFCLLYFITKKSIIVSSESLKKYCYVVLALFFLPDSFNSIVASLTK